MCNPKWVTLCISHQPETWVKSNGWDGWLFRRPVTSIHLTQANLGDVIGCCDVERPFIKEIQDYILSSCSFWLLLITVTACNASAFSCIFSVLVFEEEGHGEGTELGKTFVLDLWEANENGLKTTHISNVPHLQNLCKNVRNIIMKYNLTGLKQFREQLTQSREKLMIWFSGSYTAMPSTPALCPTRHVIGLRVT